MNYIYRGLYPKDTVAANSKNIYLKLAAPCHLSPWLGKECTLALLTHRPFLISELTYTKAQMFLKGLFSEI